MTETETQDWKHLNKARRQFVTLQKSACPALEVIAEELERAIETSDSRRVRAASRMALMQVLGFQRTLKKVGYAVAVQAGILADESLSNPVDD